MAASFIAEEGELKGLVLSLDPDTGPEWTIGRDPDVSTVLIEDSLVSRKHVLCRQTTAGIAIHNLSQTNPVLINDEELEGTILLKPGDKIRLGSSLYNFDDGLSVIDEIKEDVSPPDSNEHHEHDAPPEDDKHERFDDLDSHEDFDVQEEHAEHYETPEDKVEEPMEEPAQDTIFEEDEDDKTSFAEINFDMVNSGRWLLKVINGSNSGAEFFMHSNSSLIIGTDPNACDIVFHDTSVSRQHLKLTVSPENTITIEDLNSRNGTLVDGEQIKEKRELPLNTTVVAGTTTFVVYDREAEMKTIISPLPASLLKSLQKEESPAEEANEQDGPVAETPLYTPEPAKEESHNIAGLITIGIITGLFVIAGIGISSLFRHESVELTDTASSSQELASALAEFPSLKSFFTASTGKLYLVGHLLNSSEKNQLMYNLHGLKFVKELDDSGIVVDENVWSEMNQILSKNPTWKGVNIYASAPGKFVLSGNLQTRKQSEQLSDYLIAHFPYPDLLENKIIVEEAVVSTVSSQFRAVGLRDIVVQLANGELTLTGVIPRGKTKDFEAALIDIKKDTGVRNIRNLVNEVAPEATMINISDKYDVTGYSRLGSGAVNVVINGKILSKGDLLDGMTIKEIQPHTVLLEKDHVQYRIDFNR